jgi:hypothetical protein
MRSGQARNEEFAQIPENPAKRVMLTRAALKSVKRQPILRSPKIRSLAFHFTSAL